MNTTQEQKETRQEIVARHNRMIAHHDQMMAFLESIHSEEPYFQKLKEENDQANQEELEYKRDLGLVTEENNKASIDDHSETMERIVALLQRHQYGFKGGFHRKEDKTGYRRHLREVAAGEKDEIDNWEPVAA